MELQSPTPRRSAGTIAAALLAASALAALERGLPARADGTESPVNFAVGSDWVVGLGGPRTASSLDRSGLKTVRIPGKPAFPGSGRHVVSYEITYHYVNGVLVDTDTRPIWGWDRPPRPAVPPSFRTVRGRLGGVTVDCGFERVNADTFRATNLSVTSDGPRGTLTLGTAPGKDALLRLRARGSKVEARLNAKLEGGSTLRLTGTAEVTSASSGSVTFDVRRSAIGGPLATETSGPTGTVAGSWTVPAEIGRPEFDVVWQDATRGTVRFFGAASLIGRSGTIRRTADGGYIVESDDTTRHIEARVRADGSGWFDSGFGRQKFGPGSMVATDAGALNAADASDPGDDTAVGAGALLPPSGGATGAHTLSHGDLEDWYRIDLVARSRHAFTSTAAVVVEVFDAALAPLGGGDAVIAETSGTYYVRVRASAPGAPVSYALEWTELPAGSFGPKLTVADGAADDHFGDAVAVDGDTAIVGAASHDESGADSGVAYVFRRRGSLWLPEARLVPSDPAAEARFGAAVALSGDTALVGAAAYNSTRGAAYVFTRSGGVWTEQATIPSPDQSHAIGFGQTVALSGGTAAFSSWVNGRVYVYVRSGAVWKQASEIVAGVPGTVALDDTTLVVGTRLDQGPASVFVRKAKGWMLQQVLEPVGRVGTDAYGYGAVAVSGDTAVVGDWLDDGVGMHSGAAFVFVRSGSTWVQQARLTAVDASAGAQFGQAVAISGDTLVVGAVGAAYAFRRSGSVWSASVPLTAAGTGTGFGGAVAASGGDAFVGDWSDDDAAPDAGAAWVFAGAASK